MSLAAMPWRPQKDGSTYQWVNCSLVSVGRVWRQAFGSFGRTPASNLASWNSTIAKYTTTTLGWSSKLPTMASALRNWCVNNLASPQNTGGVSIPNSFRAAAALWGALTGSGYRWDVAFSTLTTYVAAGHPVHVIIDYRVVHNTGYDASPGFSGQASVARHSIAIAAGGYRLHTWTDSAGVKHSRYELLVHDPLADHRLSYIPQGPMWWPASLVAKGAAQSIGVSGYCEFGFGPDCTP